MFVFVDHARCNAWVLDGDLYHKGLQKFALCTGNLADSLALLVVDMSRPWLALDSLHKWTSVLRDYLDKLRAPPDTMRELEHRCEWQSDILSDKCLALCVFKHHHCMLTFSYKALRTSNRIRLFSTNPIPKY